MSQRPEPGAPGLRRFVLATFGWLALLLPLWLWTAPWSVQPAAWLAGRVLEQTAPLWIGTVHSRPGRMEAETRLVMAGRSDGQQQGVLVVEAEPARYAYGLPFLLALLLAARGPGRLRKMLVGGLLLLPAQAFSLSLALLGEVVRQVPPLHPGLFAAAWELEAIAYGYQLAVLVVPTLIPIGIWLWLDRRFFETVVVTGWARPRAVPLG